MKSSVKTLLTVAAVAMAAQASAQVTFYEQGNFQGRSFTADRQMNNLDRFGYKGRASSVEVVGNRWEVCDDIRFRGNCKVLRPGKYASVAAMGLNDQVSSVKAINRDTRIDERRYAPQPSAAQVTFYQNENFSGPSFTTEQGVTNFQRPNFNDRASSVLVTSGQWEVCEDDRFGGRCAILREGRYPSLAATGLNDRISSARLVNNSAANMGNAPPPSTPQITFYQQENFSGQSLTAEQSVTNFQSYNFNDRASSVMVTSGQWEVCEDDRFGGRCATLREGRYPSLAQAGLENRISSARLISSTATNTTPNAATAPDYRQRNNERLYEANVTSVRAVFGTPEQRCWIEKEQIPQTQSTNNVPAAIAGALIGGILGHQVGGGSGTDIATVGGVLAGAALGNKMGGSGNTDPAATRDVQRCENVSAQTQPQYWDVTYNFRGVDHRVQMTAEPGPTVTVNAQGEPRAQR